MHLIVRKMFLICDEIPFFASFSEDTAENTFPSH